MSEQVSHTQHRTLMGQNYMGQFGINRFFSCLVQVRVLLVELEEARGNQVVREDVNSAVSSSSEVQGSRQVAFRSVQELQQQNQNLLAQVRDLEEQREREQTQAKTARYGLNI